ncbi:MAG TPA: hypothetical protein VGK74_09435 [Symbiobacteriaceae bacterium]|jgi:hypothetical protein
MEFKLMSIAPAVSKRDCTGHPFSLQCLLPHIGADVSANFEAAVLCTVSVYQKDELEVPEGTVTILQGDQFDVEIIQVALE